VLNDDRSFRRRRATFNSIQKLIREQKKAHTSFPGLLFPDEIKAARDLEALERALNQARDALLAPFDPL